MLEYAKARYLCIAMGLSPHAGGLGARCWFPSRAGQFCVEINTMAVPHSPKTAACRQSLFHSRPAEREPLLLQHLHRKWRAAFAPFRSVGRNQRDLTCNVCTSLYARQYIKKSVSPKRAALRKRFKIFGAYEKIGNTKKAIQEPKNAHLDSSIRQ